MEAELETLTASLTGDATSYTRMMEEAQATAAQTARAIEEQGKRIEGLAQSIEHTAEASVSAIAALGLTAWLHSTMEASDEAEAAVIQLQATLRATGNDVEEVTDDFMEWSASIQSVTRMGDEAIFLLARQAIAMGDTSEEAKEAAKNAIALATATGMSADSAIRFTAAMARGDVEAAMMFKRSIQELKGVTDEMQLMERYQQLINAGWEAEGKLAGTAVGRLTQLKEVWGDLKEQIGSTVAEAVVPAAESLRDMVKYLQQLPQWMKDVTTMVAALGGGVVALHAALFIGPKLWAAVTAAMVLAKSAMTALVTVQGAMGSGLALTNTGALLLKATLFGLGAYLGAQFVMSVTGGTRALEEFNAAQKIGAELAEKLNDLHAARGAKTLGDALMEGDPAARMAKLVEASAAADKNLAAMSTHLNKLRADLESAGEGLIDNPLFNARDIPLFGSGLKAERGAGEAAVADYKKAYDTTAAAATALKKEIDKLNMTMVGAANEKALMMWVDMGISTMELAGKVVDLDNRTRSFTESLELEMHTLGMSTEQVELFKLAQEGATDAQLARAKSLIETKQAIAAQTSMEERAADLVKEHMTVNEQYAAQLAELDQLYANEKLSAEQYAQIQKGISDNLFGVAEAAKTAKTEVQSLDSVMAGSAEAQARVGAYVGTVREGKFGSSASGSAPVVSALGVIAQILLQIKEKPPIEVEEV